MNDLTQFDVIIVGGSSAGLSAATALGRALRKVLVIDSGKPCNKNTPHSHNFFTRDGQTPAEILAVAKSQLEKYSTVEFFSDQAVHGKKIDNGFEITTQTDEVFTAKKLIFATGIFDIMPSISGFSECWGISVIHCPYCHGYEYRNETTGILANGDVAFDIGKLISNWTKDLTIFTNGKSTLTVGQTTALENHQIKIIEKEISNFDHENGMIQQLVFKDGSSAALKAMYARVPFVQHCNIPEELSCEISESGHLTVDMWMKTNVPGIYACGDNTTPMRSIANAVFNGTVAGASVNMELINEVFQ